MTILGLGESSRLGLQQRRRTFGSDQPPPPEGEPFSDLTFWTDSTGWID